MFNIKLQLYIVSFDLSIRQQCFVSLDQNKYIIPSININEITTTTIDKYLQDIFEQIIDLGFGWINTKLIDADKQKDNVILSYACNIPPGTKLKNSYYISKNISVIDRLARKALYYV